jgi:hypothetical protein
LKEMRDGRSIERVREGVSIASDIAISGAVEPDERAARGEINMYRSLPSLVPSAADLLALEVEELAGVLLMHLNSYEGVSGNSVYQHGGISHHICFQFPYSQWTV